MAMNNGIVTEDGRVSCLISAPKESSVAPPVGERCVVIEWRDLNQRGSTETAVALPAHREDYYRKRHNRTIDGLWIGVVGAGAVVERDGCQCVVQLD